eukprot:TRINITY_DN90707_c0_g1_i1.p1 TRINITY_DN90707_c0_g1~~TRINITY_DN90707_c0_g1_i1.p1  ORF type:complete len:179 (-),score=29.42 TRINITY_DN90707_c0_g1_i1:166-663(-)
MSESSGDEMNSKVHLMPVDAASVASARSSDEESSGRRTITPKKLLFVFLGVGTLVVCLAFLTNSGPGATRLTAKDHDECLDFKSGLDYKFVPCHYGKTSEPKIATAQIQSAMQTQTHGLGESLRRTEDDEAAKQLEKLDELKHSTPQPAPATAAAARLLRGTSAP